ncbi:MAG: DnaD domain protein [Defluviitaleaceae bacterium]|nr:DnaD domain protein [Defluviitaleaceae bacterium]
MSDVNMKIGYKCSSLEIPFNFIDDYIADCLPVYPLIYIWSLRRLLDGEVPSFQEIGEHFRVTESDVIRAWRHWEKERLVSIISGKQGMEITFLPVNKKFSETTEALHENIQDANPAAVVHSRPQYTAQELACYRSDSRDVERLFSRAEKTLGKLLSYNDMTVIFGFHDWLRLPIEVIEYLLTYCEENEHRNLRYIEKCAMDWADNDIKDLETALLYVQNFDRNYREILRHMGQVSGYPTPTHRKFMNKWLYTWNFPLEIITEACDRCVEQITKPNFKYVDKILSEWHKKGVLTMEDINAADEDFETKQKNILRPLPKPNRFINFNQRDIDFDKYEKMERAYLEQKYK